MKKIKIDFFEEKNKNSIMLNDKKFKYYYNSKQVYFDAKRDCLSFICNINECVNTYYYELNLIYIQAFTHYRSYFPLLDKNIYSTNFFIIEKRFENSYKVSGQNAGYHVFHNANIIINELLNVFNIFDDFERKKRMYDKKNFIKTHINKLNSLKDSFEEL